MPKRPMLAAALLALAATTLTGCGGDDAPEYRYVDEHGNWNGRVGPDAAPAPAPEATGWPDQQSADAAYLAVVQGTDPSLGRIADDTLISVGKAVCDRLDAGQTVMEIGLDAVSLGVTPSQIAVIVGAAPSAYCPQQEAEVRQQLQDL